MPIRRIGRSNDAGAANAIAFKREAFRERVGMGARIIVVFEAKTIA
jgi:hypothetical protein